MSNDFVDLYQTLIYNVNMNKRYVEYVKQSLRQYMSEDIDKFKYFHKTDKGGYAEHDMFLGIKVPDIRNVAKSVYNEISFSEIQQLLDSKYHEERLCALIILVLKMKKADKEIKDKIVSLYLENTHNINGWDLVDMSAPYILGEYILEDKEKVNMLYDLTDTEDMWKQRISIVANLSIIRSGEYIHILNIAKKHLNTKHDLIKKAVGWMLREVGKKDYNTLYEFLSKWYKQMPRTMLRYSMEKFDKKTYKKFLKGEI